MLLHIKSNDFISSPDHTYIHERQKVNKILIDLLSSNWMVVGTVVEEKDKSRLREHIKPVNCSH